LSLFILRNCGILPFSDELLRLVSFLAENPLSLAPRSLPFYAFETFLLLDGEALFWTVTSCIFPPPPTRCQFGSCFPGLQNSVTPFALHFYCLHIFILSDPLLGQVSPQSPTISCVAPPHSQDKPHGHTSLPFTSFSDVSHQRLSLLPDAPQVFATPAPILFVGPTLPTLAKAFSHESCSEFRSQPPFFFPCDTCRSHSPCSSILITPTCCAELSSFFSVFPSQCCRPLPKDPLAAPIKTLFPHDHS